MDITTRLNPYIISGSNQPIDGSFSQVFSYRPPEEKLHQARGSLFTLISLASPDPSLNLSILAKKAWDIFHQEYYTNLTGSPSSTLAESLKKARTSIGSLIISPQSGQAKILDLNLLGLTIWGNIYYAVCSGDNSLLLWRKQNLKTLLKGESAGGEVLDNDLFILTTKQSLEHIGQKQLSQMLLIHPLEETVQILKEKILQSEKKAAQNCFLLLSTKQTYVPSEEEIIEIIDVQAPKKNSFETLKDKLGRLKLGSALTVLSFLTRFKHFTAQPFLVQIFSKLPWFNKIQKASPEVYVKSPRGGGNSRKKYVVLGALILVFAASLLATRWYREQKKQSRFAQSLLTSAKQKIARGGEMASINPKQAKKLLSEASDELGKVQGLKTRLGKAVPNSQLQNLQEKLSQTLAVNYKIDKLSATPVAGGWPKKNYQVNSTVGITNSQGNVLLAKDTAWKNIIAVQAYLGNLYLLDNQANQIHKYLRLTKGFSKRFDYFKQSVNLSTAIDFAIDGNVYILFSNKQVGEYLSGKPKGFNLSGFYPPLNNIKSIFTSAENKKLYLFGGNQVLIFDKEGAYQNGFEFDLTVAGSGQKKSNLENIFVDEAQKTLLLKISLGQTLQASY